MAPRATTSRRAASPPGSWPACASRSRRAYPAPTSTSAIPTTSVRACRGSGCWPACGSAASSGAALLVYPGGDYEVHRPTWERHRVDFGGRKGFIRLALQQDVPIVPVVSVGGQETALFLTRGEGLSRLLRLDRMFRLKVLPISLALPWGLNVGDMLGHVPLPAKIVVEALPPIHLREEFGPDPDIDEVYEHITRLMQETLEALSSERTLPVLG